MSFAKSFCALQPATQTEELVRNATESNVSLSGSLISEVPASCACFAKSM